jgi:quinol-cytochrome oxidoreductase complex cytochrome b subunit
MASNATAAALASAGVRTCPYCAEEILADAKKCKHCGEFVNRTISMTVGVIFAVGVMAACVLAGLQPAPAEAVIAVGVWSIFALLFARMFARA